jgi:uncharacterized coiled-coil protein SlyX
MHRPTPLYTTTLPILNLMNRCLLRPGFLLAGFALGVFALSPPARAVNPPPDGGYAGNNTAEGTSALFSLTSGVNNTALGFQALFSNTAEGFRALFRNTSGTQNTATGVQALLNNTSGIFNTATGTNSLASNTTAPYTTADGVNTLNHNTTGGYNTADGVNALYHSIDGSFNIAVGRNAGSNLMSGEGNIYIGAQVQPSATGEFEFIRIGNDTALTFPYDTFIAGIYGRLAGPSPLTVMCGSDGKLTANASSRRFKHDIKSIDKASEAILALKPVSFRYNNDSTNTPWFGLIAEDVAQVSEDLIVRDKEGKPFGVRYEEVNAMLLNEFLKEHRKVTEQQTTLAQQQSTISELKSAIAQQQKQIEALTTGLQKVSAQVEARKPAPQLVANP